MGGSKSVPVLLNDIEAVVVLTLKFCNSEPSILRHGFLSQRGNFKLFGFLAGPYETSGLLIPRWLKNGDAGVNKPGPLFAGCPWS